ncbi:4Fe-4S ferredoxin [Synergistales bacterium]|nr:4Fe-4S ferredoxin [Synergistales bacterium]
MTIINKDKCVGCKTCVKYCTVDAIHYIPEEKKCFVDPAVCAECYVCVRKKVCPKDAMETQELTNFYKQFQHVMSDPMENYGVTGVTGRGTEEVKTNDVTGRVKKGYAGFSIDMGRPGIGVYLRDAEKVAMAMAAAGLVFESPEKTPLSALMTDIKTGKINDDCLDYHLLSVIIEGNCTLDKMTDVFKALQKVEKEIDTVFSVGLILRVDENGEAPALKELDKLGIPQPHRGKVNVGLGRPLCAL